MVGPQTTPTPLHAALAARTGLRSVKLVLLERGTWLPTFQKRIGVRHGDHDSANAIRLSRKAGEQLIFSAEEAVIRRVAGGDWVRSLAHRDDDPHVKDGNVLTRT
jgi:hypothetical protein